MLELSTWVRRVVWFLGFTAAYLASPALFLTAAVIALVFETVFNVTNARMYWESVYATHDGYDKGNIDYVYGGYDKVDKDYEDYEDYEDYLPLKRKKYNGLNRKQTLPDYTDYIYYSDYSDSSDNSWRRSGEKKDDLEEKVNSSYKRDWRYVLGLPPWFLKT